MKNDRVYIRHILDAIDKVDQYVQVGYDEQLREILIKLERGEGNSPK